jgi:D-beta-D-heptose 7-phosphate kinase/D-beta-D-heptose 1-phosphate adenosyltransferase
LTDIPLGRILAPEELSDWADEVRAAGRTIAFTNGCFDLLHRGHVESLRAAAATADELLVAINADASVRTLKGPGRPLVPQADRAEMLVALRGVSAVTIFAEPTPLETILRVRPDVLVKGAEYPIEDIVGAQEVQAWGGRIERVPMRADWSTSRIINKFKDLI